MNTIGISIVNFRTPMLVKNLITSVLTANVKNTKLCIVVVDNDSGDDSVQFLNSFIQEEGLGETVEVIGSSRNGGYSFGNNLAIRSLLNKGCDYIWLLNPDTRVLPNACERLVECLQSSPNIGIAGSHLQDADGTGQIASFNFPTPMGEVVNSCGIGAVRRIFPKAVVATEIPKSRKKVDWVAGASMMLKAEVFREVGLLDEEYFLYFEEVDYCLHVRDAGYEVFFEPESRVVHLVGAATGISDTRKKAPRRPSYWFASRRRYFQKNFGFAGALLSEIMWILGYCLSAAKRIFKGGENLGPPYFLRDFIRNSSFYKGRIDSQKKENKYMVKDVSKNTFTGLIELIKEDWRANGRDWSRPGFRAMAVYRFGVWRMSIRRRVIRAPLSLVYRYMFRYVRNLYGIELPYSVQAGRRIVIEHQHGIVVHGDTVLGDDCILRQGVTLGNKSKDRPFDAPVIGARVSIGAGAKILGKVRVGDDSEIGANAVVITDVPANSIAVGVPAKIRRNHEETTKIKACANAG